MAKGTRVVMAGEGRRGSRQKEQDKQRWALCSQDCDVSGKRQSGWEGGGEPARLGWGRIWEGVLER